MISTSWIRRIAVALLGALVSVIAAAGLLFAASDVFSGGWPALALPPG